MCVMRMSEASLRLKWEQQNSKTCNTACNAALLHREKTGDDFDNIILFFIATYPVTRHKCI